MASGERALAQQPPPSLQNNAAFLAALQNVTWESSFTNYPRQRFAADHIDILGSNGKVSSTLKEISILEPGVVKADFSSGVMLIWIFADDLQTFAIISANEVFEFDVSASSTPVRLPTPASNQPLTVAFKNHPQWQQARVKGEFFQPLDGGGTVLATQKTIPFYSHCLGVQLPSRQVGYMVLSRRRPGGWYIRGASLGTGIRTSAYGVFSPFLRSKLTGFTLRSAQFNYPLVVGGASDLATAQERYSMLLTSNSFGDPSEQLMQTYHDMGNLRRYARSYARSVELNRLAYDFAKTHFPTNKAKHFEIGTDLAESQADAGDFAGAKTTLAEVYPLLPTGDDEVRNAYSFFKTLGAAEFGLRDYPKAAGHFASNLERSTTAKLRGSMIDSLLDTMACQLALNQTAEAEATLVKCMKIQDEWAAEQPNSNFDTYKLAFACVVMKKWDEALKYSPLYQKRNWIAYEEYGRLVALLNKGDRTGAQELAKNFQTRLSGGGDVKIRKDMDAMTVRLTESVAAMTPAAAAELEALWRQQVESLRNRPLQNYIFAKVMMASIASLKGAQ